MKRVLMLCCGLLLGLGGCVAATRQQGAVPGPTVVFRDSAAGAVLSCHQELSGVRSRDFNAYFDAARKRVAQGGEEDQLRLICLSLNVKANYRQFRKGVEVLKAYIRTHPDSRPEMQGLLSLVERLDQAKIARWSVRKKLLDEKEELEAELAELRRRAEILEQDHRQDQVRIEELRKQIDQLKNIENIIKNREHGS